jgi:hypothetical protein
MRELLDDDSALSCGELAETGFATDPTNDRINHSHMIHEEIEGVKWPNGLAFSRTRRYQHS